ncbi:MAG: hypothetical protein HYW50_00960 [Candidatus Diapherotrites archaeon]|nr:hypothetical protein [Candidatus Diapherotrites archaeon]
MNSTQNTSKDLYHIVILLLLIFALWFSVSWFFGCKAAPVPFGCDLFWGIFRFPEAGKAKVLIVYGDGGLGNHRLLEETLSNPVFFVARPESQHIDRVTLGNLRNYDLVIVEEARQMSSEELKMFIDFAALGGRLVWTGDAGTVLKKGDKLLLEYERPNGSNENSVLSPWARKIGNQVVAFDELISVNFLGNFCELKTCPQVPQIGTLVAPDRGHDLVKAIRPNLKMFGNFAVVETRKNSYSKIVLSVDVLSELVSDQDVYSDTYNPQQFPECSDGLDNDGDGRVDFDGLDTNGDGAPDIERDPGCTSASDDFEGGTERPGTERRDAECDDGLDNDRDAKTDFPNDSCCLSGDWDDEASCTENLTECSNGMDDDDDGKIDFGQDSGCRSAADNSEGNKSLGKTFPIIVTSGFGERVAYYAIPPEFWVSNQMPVNPETGQRYSYASLVENMYFGMIE